MPSKNSSNNLLEATGSEWSGDERRDGDRRGRPTRPWSGILGPLRRVHGRRGSDRVGYVDRYSRRDVALILTVFVLNVGDAFLTMLWLSRGGKEANPVMDFFLDIGPWAFLLHKCAVVGLWLVVLLVHKNFRFARIGLYASLAAYVVLMLVHFGIIASGVQPPELHDAEQSRMILEDDLERTDELVATQMAGAEDPRAINRRDDRPAAE